MSVNVSIKKGLNSSITLGDYMTSIKQNIENGCEWPYHYRGTKYHYNSEQEVWWQTFKDGLKTHVKSGHERILKAIMPLKTMGGTFRITEIGDVIAKIEKGDDWIPIFVCEMDQPFKFNEEINLTPKKIKPGDLWVGFYDGARYSYLLDKVWWRNPNGPRQYIKQTLPNEVMVNLRTFKSTGGSFRITENGYIITLIPKQPLPNNIKEQWSHLSDIQQRLIATKVENTEMLPIYIGRFYEGITLKEPTDFMSPLKPEEKKKMLNFLDGFSPNTEFEGMVPKNINDDELMEDFLDDPED